MSNLAALSNHPKKVSTRKASPPKSFLYFNDNNKFVPRWLGDEIIEEYPVFFDGNHFFFYEGGVYKRDHGGMLGRIIVNKLGDSFKQSYFNETAFYMKNRRWIEIESINRNDDLINLKNGLLNWKTGELLPHTHEYLTTTQIPVHFNPEAKAPAIRKFFSEIVPTDTVSILEEWFGYTLIPTSRHEKSMILFGSGANGKSKLIELYEVFIGAENISNVSLQDLEDNRFMLAELYGKMANVYADLPSETMKKTNVFKTTASGDTVTAEFKNRDAFKFKPFAKLMFSANELPRTTDLTDGYFRKLLIVEFPNKFGEGGLPKDPQIMSKLTTVDELSGLLNMALEGLRRLEANNCFSTNESTNAAIAQYKKDADPVATFIDEVCKVGDDVSCDKKTIYSYYSTWCYDSGFKPLGKIKFYKRLETTLSLQEYRPSSSAPFRFRGIGILDTQ